jgi:hypothetical protein
MSISNAYIYNFRPDGSNDFGTLAVTATSASVALPVNTETLMIQSNQNAHFRISSGASTAVQGDPFLSPQQGPIVVKLSPSIAYTLSAVLDLSVTPASNMTVSYGKVMEA